MDSCLSWDPGFWADEVGVQSSCHHHLLKLAKGQKRKELERNSPSQLSALLKAAVFSSNINRREGHTDISGLGQRLASYF